MIQAGKNIISPSDNLQKTDIYYLYKTVKDPKPSMREFVEQLRTLKTINEQQYSKQKRKLPYITTGIFKPPFRKTDNFAVIQYFILDLDHISENNKDMNKLREALKKDPQIVLVFASPGADGLKVFLKLKHACYDHAKYSIFYKAFAQQFAVSKNLENIVDMRTSDVTRACFFSYDPLAWYNENAVAVDMENYIDFNNPYAVWQKEKEIKKHENAQQDKIHEEQQNKQIIEDDALIHIKKTLNPNYKTKAEKQIYVPQETEEVLDELKQSLEKHSLNLENITNINYGKKLRISLGRRWAEINLFYGKKGYSLVKTPKKGSDKELTDIAHQILCQCIFK